MNQIGGTIRRARCRAGITQKQLTDHLGFTSAQFISNVERGKCLMSTDKIWPTAEFLGVDPEELLQAQLTDYELRIREANKKARRQSCNQDKRSKQTPKAS